MTPEARKRRRAQAQKHNTDVREDVRRKRWVEALNWAANQLAGDKSSSFRFFHSDDDVLRLVALLAPKYDIRTRPKNWPSARARQERGA